MHTSIVKFNYLDLNFGRIVLFNHYPIIIKEYPIIMIGLRYICDRIIYVYGNQKRTRINWYFIKK